MVIALTDAEKAELASAGSLIRPLAGADGAVSTSFHNPKTGQEFVNLPVDPRALGRYLNRGWQTGPATDEMRQKWADGEAERQAANDALMAEHMEKAPSPIEETPRFAEAVAAAVTKVLEKLNEKQEAPPQEEKAEVEPEGVQLALFAPTDAPSESETKRVVSQASRPDLHLVE